jgi:metal-sulfur cluster biosynthetic enzyme
MTTIDDVSLVDQVRSSLNDIIDPCSAASGCAAGLVDMGLVRSVTASPATDASGQHVSVTLAITHPFCMMSAVFINEARTRIMELDAVTECDVQLDAGYLWTDNDLTPEYANRRRLSLIERGVLVEGVQP